MADNPVVAIVMGSISDKEVADSAAKTLDKLGVEFETRVLSAHRTPNEVHEFASGAKGRGIRVIIAIAGMSAALSGVVAAAADCPVIGVPVSSGTLGGLDALLATAQMPPGIPVACMAVGKAGATNAAVMAAKILALSDEAMAATLTEYRESMRKKVLETDAGLQG